MEGIHFSNSDLHYFKSKNAKSKFKSFLKEKFNEDEVNFIENINNEKNNLIEKYMNKQKLINYNFDVQKKNGNNGVRIEVELLMEENQREIQKIKLNQKINKIKEENLKEKIIKNNIKIKNKLKKDKRVTKDMEILYRNALTEVNDIDDPKEILDDLDYYKEELENYLKEVEKSEHTPYAKYLMYNNNYTKYLSFMTKVQVKIPKEISKEAEDLKNIVGRKVI